MCLDWNIYPNKKNDRYTRGWMVSTDGRWKFLRKEWGNVMNTKMLKMCLSDIIERTVRRFAREAWSMV